MGRLTVGWLLVLVALATGCFNAGVTPRTGDLLAPGEVGGGGILTVITYAPGEIALADGDTATGNSGQRALVHPIAWLAPHVMNTQGWLRVGVTRAVEVGFALGMQQLGGELRFGLSDEDRGDVFSSALGFAGMWRPWADADGPWLALSLDTSRRFGLASLLFDLHVTYGPEDHAMGIEARQGRECGSFGEEGCGEYGPPRHFAVSQGELRASAALGVAFDPEVEGPQVILALTPYVVAWQDPDNVVYDCVGCSYLDPVALDEDFGVSLVLGLEYSGVRQ